MRALIVFLMLAMLPLIACAQSKADYQRVMGKFVKFYNNKQGDSIVHLWQLKDRKSIAYLWKPEEMNKLHETYGKIKSFKYAKAMTGEAKGVEFQTIFSNIEPNASGMVLDDKNYIYTFVLIIKEPKAKSAKK